MANEPEPLTEEELVEFQTRAEKALRIASEGGLLPNELHVVQMHTVVAGMSAHELLRLVAEVRRLREIVREVYPHVADVKMPLDTAARLRAEADR